MSGPICVASRPGRANDKASHVFSHNEGKARLAAKKALEQKLPVRAEGGGIECDDRGRIALCHRADAGRKFGAAAASIAALALPARELEHRLEAERTIDALAGRCGVEHRHKAAPRNLGATCLKDAGADALAAPACGDQHHADPGKVVRIGQDRAAGHRRAAVEKSKHRAVAHEHGPIVGCLVPAGLG